MKEDQNETPRVEEVALKKEQAYIQHLLGMKTQTSLESEAGGQDDCISSCDEIEECFNKTKLRCVDRATSVMSSDGGYASSSDEEKKNKRDLKESKSTIVDIIQSSQSKKKVIDVFNFQNIPEDLHYVLPGIDHGLPNDYLVPIEKRPDWLDMKKFKIGQKFAQKYFFGLNYSDMLALIILFALPDGLEPLIYTGNSGTPFTAFRRYLSTVLRVNSWYEHDVWKDDNLGFRNLRTVRALHLNVSKRLNSTPYDELKSQLTLWGTSSETGVWSTMTQEVQEDFLTGCPFQSMRPVNHERPEKVFVSQLDMSITQFGFFGLMIMHPDKFGAGSATEEELDGFVHMWRGLGYLLGIDDRFNFCNGTLSEVKQRCHHLVEHWVKPSFQHVTEDWEHMSRCMVEGLSYYVPGVTFEVSLLYLCWVLDVPAPRLYKSLTWGQTCMFYIMRFTFNVTLRIPGMLSFHNWLLHRTLKRVANLSQQELHKLENKKYDYTTKGKFNTRL